MGIFLSVKLSSWCVWRALPLEQCKVPGGISLGSPSEGQLCPERQANTDSAAQGSEWSERPDLVSIKTVFTLGLQLRDVPRAGKHSCHGCAESASFLREAAQGGLWRRQVATGTQAYRSWAPQPQCQTW